MKHCDTDTLYGGVRVVAVPGIQGPAGPKGPRGPQGDQGPQGIQGERGPRGPQGIQGPEGPVGPQGESFAPDANGSLADRDQYDDRHAGFTFLDVEGMMLYYKVTQSYGDWSEGSSLRGPQGYVGPKGDTGAQGPKGDKGDKGDTGPQGIQGPQGERGPQGEAGPRGPEGPQGERGPEGERGPVGPRGVQGEAGAKGDKGEPGTSYQPSYLGTEAERHLYDGYMRDISFLATDTGLLYFKLSNAYADWSEGISFGRGPKGEDGKPGEAGQSANEVLMEPDPVAYFDEIYGESTSGILTVQQLPVSPDPTETFEEALN